MADGGRALGPLFPSVDRKLQYLYDQAGAQPAQISRIRPELQDRLCEQERHACRLQKVLSEAVAANESSDEDSEDTDGSDPEADLVARMSTMRLDRPVCQPVARSASARPRARAGQDTGPSWLASGVSSLSCNSSTHSVLLTGRQGSYLD